MSRNLDKSSADGRVARREKNREAVIAALTELYTAGNPAPTIDDVANHVGLTSRTIYMHFQDREALSVEVGQRQLEKYPELFGPAPAEGQRQERIKQIVDHRAKFFEVISPVRRAAILAMHASAVIRKQQIGVAKRLRKHVEQSFGPELKACGDPRARAQLLESLDMLTNWEI